jgi:hypothetical protein
MAGRAEKYVWCPIRRPTAQASARSARASVARRCRWKEISSMCGRYAITTAPEAILRPFRIGGTAPNLLSQDLPVIRLQPKTGERVRTLSPLTHRPKVYIVLQSRAQMHLCLRSGGFLSRGAKMFWELMRDTGLLMFAFGCTLLVVSRVQRRVLSLPNPIWLRNIGDLLMLIGACLAVAANGGWVFCVERRSITRKKPTCPSGYAND